MKTVLKWTGRLVLVLLVGFGLLALLGPREKVDLSAGFDASLLGDDIDDYFEREEAKGTRCWLRGALRSWPLPMLASRRT